MRNGDEPPGQRNNALKWLQKRVMDRVRDMPRDFTTRTEWETFRAHLRQELPRMIGLPSFPPLEESAVRGCLQVGADAVCERVDIYVDEDYAIPAFVFQPASSPDSPMPALVWNPGWPEDKWKGAYLAFAARMARHGFVTLIPDHAPFGETSDFDNKHDRGMTLLMGMGEVLGIRACPAGGGDDALRRVPALPPGRGRPARGRGRAVPGRSGHLAVRRAGR